MRRVLNCALLLLVVDCSMVNFRGPSGAMASASASSVAAAFEQIDLVPDVVPVAPAGLAEVKYPSGARAELGNYLSPAQVPVMPNITYSAHPACYYTLATVDPDVPSRSQPHLGEFCHWLVGNIPGDDVNSGDTLAACLPPTPPPGSGRHRYVYLIYQQPGNIQFDEEDLLSLQENRYNFSVAKFAEKYNLGDPIAGNFYQSGVLEDML